VISSQFSIVKFVPDAARDEPVNIGIVAWHLGTYVLKLDPRSFPRVLSNAPDLEKDAFDFSEDLLRMRIDEAFRMVSTDLSVALHQSLEGPFRLSQPGELLLQDPSESALRYVLENEVDQLIDRLVKPPKRSGRDYSKGARALLRAAYLAELPAGSFQQEHDISATRSGVRRTVDFYMNSDTNAAIDVIELNRNAKEEAVTKAADAMRAKCDDILSVYGANLFIAHLPLDQKPDLAGYHDLFLKLLKRDKVQLVTTLDENLNTIRDVVSH
jgi:hypothetical protein